MPPTPGHFADSSRAQRNLCGWTLLAALILLAALAGPFFAGRIYTRDDLGAYHLPVRSFYAQQLARGESFDWMPQLYAGFYLTGEGQAGTYHPWHRLLYRWLPLRAALAWEYLASYPFLLAGCWLLLRRRLQRSDAAMVGALVFTFSAFNLLHFVHPNAIAIVGHIPWLLWAIDVALTDSRRRTVAAAQAGIALLTASQLLLGYPQYVWFSLLAEGAYAAFLYAGRKYAPRDGCDQCASCAECVGCGATPWPRLVIAKGTGLLIGGIQLVPTLDAMLQSTRPAADAAFTQAGSLHPLNLVQLVAPYLFADRVLGGNTHELSVYIGAVPLVLIVWLAMRRGDLGRLKPLAWAAAGFGLLSLFLAFGQYGQVYRLQYYVPLIGRFRCPCRYLVLFHLSAAVLAAIGFLLLEREGRKSVEQRGLGRRTNDCPAKTLPETPAFPLVGLRRFEAIWATLAVALTVALAGFLIRDRSCIAGLPAILAGPVLLAAAAAAVLAAARGVRGALVAVVLLAAADLGYYGMSYSAYAQTERLENYVASAPTPPGIPSDPADHRVFAPPLPVGDYQVWTGDQMTLRGWHRTDGYAGLEPKRRLDYSQLAALRVSATRWVERDEATARIEGLIPRGDDWLEVPNPLPRVRLVTQIVPSRDPADDIRRIAVESAALCDYPLAMPKAAPGTAELLSDGPGRLDIAVACRKPQVLVVAESYHQGWRALVDGRPREVFRVNGDFLGVPVGPGDGQVVLQFAPGSLVRGWLASCAGLMLAAACFLGAVIRAEVTETQKGRR